MTLTLAKSKFGFSWNSTSVKSKSAANRFQPPPIARPRSNRLHTDPILERSSPGPQSFPFSNAGLLSLILTPNPQRPTRVSFPALLIPLISCPRLRQRYQEDNSVYATGRLAVIMLLPKGGVNWKAAKSRLPPTRALLAFVTRTRFLLCVAIAGITILLWRGISTSASEMQK